MSNDAPTMYQTSRINKAMFNAQNAHLNPHSHNKYGSRIEIPGSGGHNGNLKIAEHKNQQKEHATQYCLDAFKLHSNEENPKGYFKNDFKKSIYYSRISSVLTNAAKKGAQNAKKINDVEKGFFNKLPVNKIIRLNINCSVFENKASSENIGKMTKFFEENGCKFSILEESFRTYEFELKRLLDLYKNDISADWSIDKTNIETLCNGTQFFKNVGIDTEIAKSLIPWKEFKVTINPSKLPEGELKTALTNHLNRKINENGREINSFSQDITEIIDSAFQKYLEKNKLTFDCKDPNNSINYNNALTSGQAIHT